MGTVLIYGATGYTGKLLAERAASTGMRPILAARDARKLQAVAEPLGFEWRAFDLLSDGRIREGLKGVAAVLHAAGPFSATAAPMSTACLKSGAHYVDVTGEIDVFEMLAARDAEGRAAGVTLLPGAGFDVVPSDCLLAHVASRLSDPARLRLSLGGFGGFSRGTAKTMLESVSMGVRVRRNGQLVELVGPPPRAEADFGAGVRETIGVGWGDVATAWVSTGVPDIEVFFEAAGPFKSAARTPGFVRRLLASGVAQRFLKRQIELRLPEGPTAAQRAAGSSLFVAEAWSRSGERVATRMETAEAYELTSWTALEIARRAADGLCPAGYQTPSRAFGPDFILGFPGTTRTDL